jgi:hypothetical protein
MSFQPIQISKLNLTESTSVMTDYLKELPDGSLTVIPTKSLVNIAPLNSINNFLSIIETTFILLLSGPEVEIPKRFTWNDGKTDISKVFTQYNCGCCWIIAATQTINDSVVCNSLIQVKKNPGIDPTNLLVCFKSMKNGKCKGGNSLDALQYVEKNGIEFKGLNYDWCSKNKKCYKPSPPGPVTPMFVLNNSIPKKCPKKKFIKFYVQNIKQFIVSYKERNNKKKIKNCIERVKEHILNNGPVVAGYMVYTNFLKGNFLREGNSHAIYFDKYDYERDKYSKDTFPIQGPHSVSIVGWGYDDNVDGKFFGEKDGTKHTVEYWIVRNSWGTKWGIEGYFRIAMYPYNKDSQFEVSLNVEGFQQESLEYGGFLAFESSIIPNYKNTKEKYESKNDSCSLEKVKWIFLIILFIIIFYKILFSI